MITKHVPVKNSAFPEATSFMLLAAKTIRIGTKHAIPLYPTPVVSFLSRTSKLWAAQNVTAPTLIPADRLLAP